MKRLLPLLALAALLAFALRPGLPAAVAQEAPMSDQLDSTPTPDAETAPSDDTAAAAPTPADAPAATAVPAIMEWAPAPPTKASGCVARGPLPDPDCTPGALLPVAAGQVCVSGYATSVRDVPTSVHNRVYAAYGITSHPAGSYEVDHLISLELGGSNDQANLWPEPYTGEHNAHEKDRVENAAHKLVCDGTLALADAQRRIATDWTAFYSDLVAAGAIKP